MPSLVPLVFGNGVVAGAVADGIFARKLKFGVVEADEAKPEPEENPPNPLNGFTTGVLDSPAAERLLATFRTRLFKKTKFETLNKNFFC